MSSSKESFPLICLIEVMATLCRLQRPKDSDQANEIDFHIQTYAFRSGMLNLPLGLCEILEAILFQIWTFWWPKHPIWN